MSENVEISLKLPDDFIEGKININPYSRCPFCGSPVKQGDVRVHSSPIMPIGSPVHLQCYSHMAARFEIKNMCAEGKLSVNAQGFVEVKNE